MLQLGAITGFHAAADDVERGFVSIMVVGDRLSAGGYHGQKHAQAGRACGARGDSFDVGDILFRGTRTFGLNGNYRSVLDHFFFPIVFLKIPMRSISNSTTSPSFSHGP